MLVLGFAKVPRDVSSHEVSKSYARRSSTTTASPTQNAPVLDHTLNLPPHRQEHEDQPVHHQHRPEHWQVENLAPTAQEAQSHSPCRRMPEFELGESAHKRLELLVVLRGKRGLTRRHAVFHIGVCVKGGIEFGGDECKEEVEEVDA